MATSTLTVVALKGDYSDIRLLELPSPSTKLSPSSVRVQPALIGLTANNVSYAAAGSLLHWWDTYPIPSAAPNPYNDRSKYGIVPVWGYGIVVESTMAEISESQVLFGFWPMSSRSVDLLLEAVEPKGHFLEHSPHRREVMPLYNRYLLTDVPASTMSLPPSSPELAPFVRAASGRPLWMSAYMLNRFVFPADPGSSNPIHPFGNAPGMVWTREDADLTDTIIFNLSAASKTGTSLASELATRPADTGPLALLNVTSSTLPGILTAKRSYPTRLVPYDQVLSQETLAWLSSHGASRLLLLDFGATPGFTNELIPKLRSHFPDLKLVTFDIGAAPKVHTADDIKKRGESAAALGKIRSNASGQREAAVARDGPEKVYGDMDRYWEDAVKRDIGEEWHVRVQVGLKGDDGLEGAWKSLCQGKVVKGASLAFKLN